MYFNVFTLIAAAVAIDNSMLSDLDSQFGTYSFIGTVKPTGGDYYQVDVGKVTLFYDPKVIEEISSQLGSDAFNSYSKEVKLEHVEGKGSASATSDKSGSVTSDKSGSDKSASETGKSSSGSGEATKSGKSSSSPDAGSLAGVSAGIMAIAALCLM